MPSRDKLAEFTAWCGKHIAGDEKGEAQIFLDHLFQAFGYAGGLKEAGVWIAEDPDHMIHFNGEWFLGPYPDVVPKV